MDEFKKYLKNHRDKLDLDEPGQQLWENIRQKTEPAKKAMSFLTITKWAIAACILLLAGIGIKQFIAKNADNKSLQVKSEKEISTPVQKTMPIANIQQPIAISVPKTQPTANSQQPIASKPEARNFLHEIETSFTQVIDLQRSRISHTPMYTETPDYFKDFTIEIRQIEKDEKVIKSDIAKRGLTDELLDQLINLYQQKLNTLKQLQIEMNKTNNRYKQSRGPVDSVKTYFLNI